MTTTDHDHDGELARFGDCITCARADVTKAPASSPPAARRTDPTTSHQAARSLPADLRPSQVEVLRVIRQAGPLTLEQLVDKYLERAQLRLVARQSGSGIRTRCRELMDLGLVEDTGRTVPTASGRPARLLAATRSR